MDTFIVLCENPQCCAVFPVLGIIGGPGSVTVHMTNAHAGPCPACGSYGRIPDGIYHYSNQLIKFLNGPKESIEKLKSVESLLRSFKPKDLSRIEVIKKVESISPNIAEVLNQAPDTPFFQQWIAIIIASIALAIQIHSTYFKQENKDIEKLFIEHLLKEHQHQVSIVAHQEPKAVPYKRPTLKISPNAQCPCGSAKKYKRCCGKNG